jgi:hypothetical protein
MSKDVAALATALKALLDATPETRRLDALDAVDLTGVTDKERRRHLTQRGFIEGCRKMRESAMLALAAGHQTVTVTLTTLGLSCLLDELDDRPGYGRLLRDDAIDRLNAAIDRLEVHSLALGIMAVNGDGKR